MRTLVVNALRMTGQRTGVGRHIQYLAEQWSRMDVPFDRVVFMSRSASALPHLGSTTSIEFEVFDGGHHGFVWEQFDLPRRAWGAAMLFCPAYTGPLVFPGPTVLANHGIYEALPSEFSWVSRLRATPIQRWSARKARRVIANSLATRDDLVRFFGITPTKIDTVYPAAHDLFFERHEAEAIDAEVTRAIGRPVPYVIFVGKLAKRRHVPNLIHALSLLRREAGLPHHLLIIGPNTAGVSVAQLARAHAVGDAVTYLPFVEQEALAKLYAGADVFALPTTYEGISQTIFEAMASGTAVLTVDHPTLREGAGDAVLSMPTPEVKDLVTGLRSLLTDPCLRAKYEERGRRQAQRFSWRAVATETMRILDQEASPCDVKPGA